MICYLPELYEDETVYSWFGRYLAHSGYPCYTNALEDLLIKKTSAADVEFLGPLNKDAQKAIAAMLSLEDLVLAHTMFPQYARFLEEEKQTRAISALIRGDADVYNLLPIPVNRTRRTIQYCPVCAQEDRARYGEAYFHRTHLIRGMTVCDRHMCRLKSTEVEISKRKTLRLFVPEDAIPTDIGEAEFDIISDQMNFSKYLSQVFQTPLRPVEKVKIGDYLSAKLDGTRYLSTSGQKRMISLLYDDIIERFADWLPQGIIEPYHVQKVFTGDCVNFLWICQVAFILGISPEELSNPAEWGNSISASRWMPAQKRNRNHAMRKGKTKIDWGAEDKKMVTEVMKIASSIYIGEAGRPGRVTESAICRVLNWPSKRFDRLPLCRAEVYKYHEDLEHYWARECVWAYSVLKQRMGEKTVFWKNLRDLTNLRKKNFEKCIPYLEKYTSSETAEKIRNLI